MVGFVAHPAPRCEAKKAAQACAKGIMVVVASIAGLHDYGCTNSSDLRNNDTASRLSVTCGHPVRLTITHTRIIDNGLGCGVASLGWIVCCHCVFEIGRAHV